MRVGRSALVLTALLVACGASAQQPAVMREKPPELVDIQTWVNSKPLKLSELKGKVVVLHFWTFG